jgi:pimeloyl-ACP methyl ester carboxylesterase
VEVDIVTVGDAELEVRRVGSGPPLLYLHGEDGLIFSSPLLESLGERFEVLAPHLPAFGRSRRPSYVKTVRDLAFVVAEYLDTVDAPVPVVGASLGGWVALETALVARSNVAQLVVAAPVGVKLGDREDRDFEDLWVADLESLPSILYGDPTRAPDLNELSDDDLLHITQCQEAVARYCWSPYMHDPALRHWARRIECPVMIVSGSADRFALLPDYYARLARTIGDGAVHQVLDGVGHRVEEEAPVQLASLVTDFVTVDRRSDEAVPAGRS